MILNMFVFNTGKIFNSNRKIRLFNQVEMEDDFSFKNRLDLSLSS